MAVVFLKIQKNPSHPVVPIIIRYMRESIDEVENLEYSEFHKGREITINFDRICPYSSNTIQNQVCKQIISNNLMLHFDIILKNDFQK